MECAEPEGTRMIGREAGSIGVVAAGIGPGRNEHVIEMVQSHTGAGSCVVDHSEHLANRDDVVRRRAGKSRARSNRDREGLTLRIPVVEVDSYVLVGDVDEAAVVQVV